MPLENGMSRFCEHTIRSRGASVARGSWFPRFQGRTAGRRMGAVLQRSVNMQLEENHTVSIRATLTSPSSPFNGGGAFSCTPFHEALLITRLQKRTRMSHGIPRITILRIENTGSGTKNGSTTSRIRFR